MENRSTRLHVEYSADGERYLSRGDDMYENTGGSLIKIWSVGADTLISTHDHGEGVIFEGQWSPDGTLIASAIRDEVRVWSVADGTYRNLMGHEEFIRDISFSSDSRMLATASEDRTVRIWSLDSDNPPIVLRGHNNAVTSVRFANVDKYVVTGSFDGSGRVWAIDREILISKACAIVGRDFTKAELQQYFDNRTFTTTCPR